jgi:hypothetical protein
LAPQHLWVGLAAHFLDEEAVIVPRTSVVKTKTPIWEVAKLGLKLEFFRFLVWLFCSMLQLSSWYRLWAALPVSSNTSDVNRD